jgi:hypothetical protein
MKRSITMLAATAALAGCNQGGESKATNAVAPRPAASKHPTYCFFKDTETKSWSASAGRGGLVTVKGKGHVKDPRYRAQLGESEIAGTKATLWLTIGENRGYASPDNWWDVSLSVPGSARVTSVAVMCGKKTVAELKIRR